MAEAEVQQQEGKVMSMFSDAERRTHATELSGKPKTFEDDMKDFIGTKVRQPAGATVQKGDDPQPPAKPPEAIDPTKGTPVDRDFRKNIIRLFDMVDDVVEDTRAMRDANADLKARNEQYQIKVNELSSLVETLKMEKEQLRDALAAEKEHLIRLYAHIEQNGNNMVQIVQEHRTRMAAAATGGS
jgi:hypothetical protein